jgi:hypothetical protein
MTKSLLTTVIIGVLLAPPAMAQPRVVNGDLQTTTVAGPLTRAALDALAGRSGTAWLVYGVPIVEGDRWVCDGMSYGGNVTTHAAAVRPGQRPNEVLMLEGPRLLYVLYRLDRGRIERIRVASDNCTLDAGGLPVLYLPTVSPADSVAVLGSFLVKVSANRLANGALTALAMHREPAALERLLTTARDGESTHLRGQALFWLSQRAGDKAVGAISDAIATDPETEVKKRAVFALSQLPKDEGVPRLIDVARTNANPAVRKQAMFWLGQSRDPRAVKFFEEILFK